MKMLKGYLVVMVISCLVVTAFGAEAIPNSSVIGDLHWSASGRVSAECVDGEALTGVGCITRWDLNKQKRLGQTFRCAGPILKAVQLGIDNGIDSNYVRFYYGDADVKITVRVKKGGVNGTIVAEKLLTPDAKGHLPATPIIEVNQPTDSSVLWYYELEVADRHFVSSRVRVTIAYDNYPAGCMWRDGKKVANRDLPLVVYRSWNAQAKIDNKVCFWWADSQERIWLDAKKTVGLMLAKKARQAVRIASAKNEWETFQLIATPAPNMKIAKAKLEITPFVGPDGAVIGKDNIRIWWLRYSKEYNNKCVYDKTIEVKDVDKGYGSSGILFPDPLKRTNIALIPQKYIKYITKQLNTAFVVSVYVPENTDAGIYKSQAKLVVNDKIVLKKPIVLEVFDFALPKKTHTRTALFTKVAGSFDGQKKLINLFADYRIAVPTFPKDTCGILRKNKFSEQAYREILGEQMQRQIIELSKLLNSKGLDVCGVFPWADTYRVWRGQKGGRRGIIRFWKVYYPILKKYGWDKQTYARLPDEISVKQIPKAKPIAELFRKYAPTVKIMITSTGTTDPKALAKVVGLPDIWTPGLTWARKSTLEFFESRAKSGDKVWPYIHDSLYHITDVSAGRMFFWLLQNRGFDGCTYWCLGPRGKYRPAWFGIIRRDTVWSGDGGLLYPADIKSDWGVEGGAGSTERYWIGLRVHRIRDGIEDREYFWLMNHLAEKLAKQGKLTKALREQINELNKTPSKVAFGMGNFIHNPEKINHIRKQIANIIVAMQRGL